MVVDTSAVVAVILLEPEADVLGPKMLAGDTLMAAPNALEAYMVLRKHLGEDTEAILERNLRRFGIEIVPFDAEHLTQAQIAFDRFGKGRHPARLNFGDCVAYALAKVTGQPLLFTGDDFARTDIPVA